MSIISGQIVAGAKYLVTGEQSVNYNGHQYTTGQNFRGVINVKTFTWSGSGTQGLEEICEMKGANILFEPNFVDKRDYRFNEPMKLKGFSVLFEMNDSDKRYLDKTRIFGASVLFEHTPLRTHSVTSRRL